MRFTRTWYNRDGETINITAADKLLGDPDYKRVGLTNITSATDPGVSHLVSTVWLGLDHSHEEGPPVIFETMVFSDGDTGAEEWTGRYSTEGQAKAGHAEIITVIAATVPDEVIADLDSWPTGS